MLEHDKWLILEAFKLLGWRDCSYVLFHVIEIPISSPIYNDALNQLISKAEQKLRETQEWLSRQGYSAEVKVVASRDVVDGILEETEKYPYSLVLLHKKKRRRVVEQVMLAFVKSTSQGLIQESSIPVMVIPVKEH